MRKRIIKTILCLAAALLLFSMPIIGKADFGDFSGDSDYGGSDWDSDYDSGWDSDYSSSWDDDDDDDYSWSSSGSSNSGGSGGSGGDSSFGGFIACCVIFGIPCLLIYRARQKRAEGRKQQRQNNHTGQRQPLPPGAAPTTGLRPLSDIYKTDPDFSPEDLKQRLANLYVQMQNGWQAKDISSLQGDFTPQSYGQFDRQLQRYRDERQTSVIERIAVMGVELKGLAESPNHDVIIANLRTRITSYVLDDRTGTIIQGSKNAAKFMEYEWTLVRPKGKKTVKQTDTEAFNCPNCGGTMNINMSARCPYCGTLITKANYDWVIAEIKGLSQRTG